MSGWRMIATWGANLALAVIVVIAVDVSASDGALLAALGFIFGVDAARATR